MTIPVKALPANTQREPVLPAQQPSKTAGPAREAALVGRAEKRPETAPEQAHVALAEINHVLQMASVGVRFEFDKEANTMVTKVVDMESGEMIRQMPSEEAVHLSKALGKLQGLLVSQKV
ncbi:MAG: flagellar protein FlaG [Polaromonas sp.]|uniref:flagellar protein FlaG n=1 Tax=Polaromonas sp. TaxID=1869339 RepID=UPI002487EABA|nr:flagellar protein FlaG [Polaromonas sp.]MDI1268724.1 flagellar protein FlaG [Polaromonas sp.]